MGKNPMALANKTKMIEKTIGAMREDMHRRDGLPIGYAVVFFDPLNPDVNKEYSYCMRTALLGEEFDEEQNKLLEEMMLYICAGIQKIFDDAMGEDGEERKRRKQIPNKVVSITSKSKH